MLEQLGSEGKVQCLQLPPVIYGKIMIKTFSAGAEPELVQQQDLLLLPGEPKPA